MSQVTSFYLTLTYLPLQKKTEIKRLADAYLHVPFVFKLYFPVKWSLSNKKSNLGLFNHSVQHYMCISTSLTSVYAEQKYPTGLLNTQVNHDILVN